MRADHIRYSAIRSTCIAHPIQNATGAVQKSSGLRRTPSHSRCPRTTWPRNTLQRYGHLLPRYVDNDGRCPPLLGERRAPTGLRCLENIPSAVAILCRDCIRKKDSCLPLRALYQCRSCELDVCLHFCTEKLKEQPICVRCWIPSYQR